MAFASVSLRESKVRGLHRERLATLAAATPRARGAGTRETDRDQLNQQGRRRHSTAALSGMVVIPLFSKRSALPRARPAVRVGAIRRSSPRAKASKLPADGRSAIHGKRAKAKLDKSPRAAVPAPAAPQLATAKRARRPEGAVASPLSQGAFSRPSKVV